MCPKVHGEPHDVADLSERLLMGAAEAAAIRNVQLDLGVTGGSV